MNSPLTNILYFLIGVFGEAIVLRYAAKLKLWWETCVSEDMKAKCDIYYAVLYEDSKKMGNPDE